MLFFGGPSEILGLVVLQVVAWFQEIRSHPSQSAEVMDLSILPPVPHPLELSMGLSPMLVAVHR